MNRAVAAAALCLAASAVLVADEGWIIERIDIVYDIRPNGIVEAKEAIDVDFRGLSKHGIYRDVRSLIGYNDAQNRTYDIDLVGPVMRADGSRHDVSVENSSAMRRFKIGDPDKTISGKETYRYSYTIGGSLNAFPDHDEFYWNATGDTWPVTMARATVSVTAPAGAIQDVRCFQGRSGSTEACTARIIDGSHATFAATRPLEENEQMTVVAMLRKGAIAEPVPTLSKKPLGVHDWFATRPPVVLAAGLWLLAVVGGIGTFWSRYGRDRQFVSDQYLSQDRAEEPVPLFGGRPVAVEFEPPDKIRPAQMGLLVDERADTLDVTATIVDLAVRGYIKITELEKTWWFGKKDWQIDRVKDADGALLDYERIVLAGLFDGTSSRKVSQLKTKFADDLAKAKSSLYKDAVTRGWFPSNPQTVRTLVRVLAVFIAVGGIFFTMWLGTWWGAGLAGLPVVIGGVLLFVLAGAMPRRTAAGKEALRRTLGFMRYIKTGEAEQQAFAERAHIFTAYLPYAVAFKCVDRWARAFADIDMQAATTGFYSGTSAFNPTHFSSSMSTFSSAVSSTIATTPGGSGGSGSSGSSGGGGGGGGGGSW